MTSQKQLLYRLAVSVEELVDNDLEQLERQHDIMLRLEEIAKLIREASKEEEPTMDITLRRLPLKKILPWIIAALSAGAELVHLIKG